MILLKEQIERLIPHAGAMCLIDRVVRWDSHTVHCLARSHLEPGNPLRHGGRLSSLALVEYGAQAMAIHGGLLAHHCHTVAPGYLAAVHEARFSVDYIDRLNCDLAINARAKVRLDNGVVYTFSIGCDEAGLLLEARATVINLPRENCHETSTGDRR